MNGRLAKNPRKQLVQPWGAVAFAITPIGKATRLRFHGSRTKLYSFRFE